MSKPDNLLWLDIETTGLDPEFDDILEIAAVVTDDELEVIAYKHLLINPGIPAYGMMNHSVIEMHSSNGLFDDVIKNGGSKERVKDNFIEFLQESIPDKTKTYIAGSSVNFDRNFLEQKLALKLFARFSHRVVDVSVLRTLMKMWKPEDMYPQKVTHRALDDVFDHIEELKHYRKIMGLGESNGS